MGAIDCIVALTVLEGQGDMAHYQKRLSRVNDRFDTTLSHCHCSENLSIPVERKKKLFLAFLLMVCLKSY
jgi:hypothetical protein